MILAMRHTGIVVEDLNESENFYCYLLGFKISGKRLEVGPHMDAMLGMKDVRVTTLKLLAPDGGMIELLHFTSPEFAGYKGPDQEISDIGISHLALTVKDLDHEYERLSDAGVRFLGEPVASGACRVAFALDPDGNFVELVEELH